MTKRQIGKLLSTLFLMLLVYIASRSINPQGVVKSSLSPYASTINTEASPTVMQAASFPAPSKTADCSEEGGLPDSACTPGAVDPRVTQENIHTTICVSGYTATVRPTSSYTNKLKTQQIKAYGYSDLKLGDYEEDHLISLELGGSPDSPANLWPEPYTITYSSKQKDKVENYLHAQVCAGSITLVAAQQEIASNWVAVYNAEYSTLTQVSEDDPDDGELPTPTPGK